MMSGQDDANSVRDLHKVLFQALDQARIPFYGEPLKGIQIMGLLETRTVDFDQVIILGANEGTLPSGKGMQSFIPFDIRKEFNLPTHQEKDAVFAYHFYRLMQRARKVHLVYDTEPDELGGGEQSRYITQLSYELTRYNPQVRLNKQIVSVAPSERPLQVPISIEKTQDILDILSARADSGFSPSVLSRYINCPLQFYFNFVADLSTEEDLEETIEAKTLGKVVHHALQQLYHPLVGRSAGPEEVRDLISQVAPTLEEAFSIEYPGGELHLGKNLLIHRAAAGLLRKLIEKETNDLKQAGNGHAALHILSLEKKLSAAFEIHPAGKKMTVRIKGTPDRIDILDGTTRIIDYKTGTVENSGVNVKAWEDLFLDPGLSMAFQLLVYSFLYGKARPERSAAGVVPGVLSLRNLGKGLLKVEVPERNFEEDGLPPAFTEGLKRLLEEIFDPSVAFDQAVDETRCERCDFRAICNRF
jgi:RecB family exonuclease